MSHRQHKLTDQIMSDCAPCRDELRQVVGEERMHEIMAEAAKGEGFDDAAVQGFVAAYNEFIVGEEPQLFMQIINLDMGCTPRVWLRQLGLDFMADCRVLRPKNKRARRITATGPTIEETLNNLASNVAAYLYPPASPQRPGERA